MDHSTRIFRDPTLAPPEGPNTLDLRCEFDLLCADLEEHFVKLDHRIADLEDMVARLQHEVRLARFCDER
jgi:hypothetical protein